MVNFFPRVFKNDQVYGNNNSIEILKLFQYKALAVIALTAFISLGISYSMIPAVAVFMLRHSWKVLTGMIYTFITFLYSLDKIRKMKFPQKSISLETTRQTLYDNQIPEEVLIKIFSFVELKDHVNLVKVCKTWHRIGNDDLGKLTLSKRIAESNLQKFRVAFINGEFTTRDGLFYLMKFDDQGKIQNCCSFIGALKGKFKKGEVYLYFNLVVHQREDSIYYRDGQFCNNVIFEPRKFCENVWFEQGSPDSNQIKRILFWNLHRLARGASKFAEGKKKFEAIYAEPWAVALKNPTYSNEMFLQYDQFSPDITTFDSSGNRINPLRQQWPLTKLRS